MDPTHNLCPSSHCPVRETRSHTGLVAVTQICSSRQEIIQGLLCISITVGPSHMLFWHRRPNSKAFPRPFLGQDLDLVMKGLILKGSQEVIKRCAHLQSLQAGAKCLYRSFLLENWCHLGDNAYNFFRLNTYLFKSQLHIISWKQGDLTILWSSFNPTGISKNLMQYLGFFYKKKIVW